MQTKEKTQLIALAAIVVVTAIHQFFTWVLTPLSSERATLTRDLASLKDQASSEAAELRRLTSAEDAEKANEWMDYLAGRAVKEVVENPVLSCPNLIQGAFAGTGILKCPTKLTYVLPFNAIPSGILYGWTAMPAPVNPLRLGVAVCDLERKNRLAQIESLTIATSGTDSAIQTAELVVAIPVKP
ncbi:MAG: hypothetical protein WCP06_01365 [Verrucomicrobiota bacterium]